MVSALNGPDIGKNRVLIVGRAKGDLKSSIRLKQVIKPVAIAEPDEGCSAQRIGRIAYRHRWTETNIKLVMVNFITAALRES